MHFLSFQKSSTPSLPFSVLLAAFSILHHASAQQSYSISALDTTQVTGLVPACAAVYNSTLSGCAVSDFVSTNPCSSSCISGLQSVQMEAQSACQNNDIPDSSMLSYFTNGQGVNQLCTVMKMVSGSTTMSTATKSSTATGTSTAATGTAASATTSASTTPRPSGILGLPEIAVVGIVVGAVVGCMLLALLTFCAFRVHYKN